MIAHQLLEGFKILDFTRLLPGPLATQMMAQMGAQVVKVESPKRPDYTRIGLNPVEGASHLFHQLNHLKSIEHIDYNSNEGRENALKLAADVDVLVEQFRPGAMEAWGLGYHEVKAVNPSVIYASISGYGALGEHADEAGHDLNYLSHTGMMSLMKDDDGKPIVAGCQYADIAGSFSAVMAIQAALLRRSQTGAGCRLDIPLAGSVAPFLTLPFSFQASGMDHEAFNLINGRTAVNYAVYKCKDGKWISVGALEVKFWNNICDAVDRQDWKRDNQIELMVHSFPKAEVEVLFQSKSREEWMEVFRGTDTCVAPIIELSELEQSTLMSDLGAFYKFQTAGGTQLTGISLPFGANE